jgi:hypothetical protein
VILYHYTAPGTSHLGGILEIGEIKPTISDGSVMPATTPPHVFLTTSESGGGVDYPEKALSCLFIDFPTRPPQLFHYWEWAWENGGDPEVLNAVAALHKVTEWWVHLGPITRERIKGLLIMPVNGVPARDFYGSALEALFDDPQARASLRLPETKKVRWDDRGVA